MLQSVHTVVVLGSRSVSQVRYVDKGVCTTALTLSEVQKMV